MHIFNSGRKKPFGRYKLRCWANIKFEFKIIRCEDVKWTEMPLVERPVMYCHNYGNESLCFIRDKKITSLILCLSNFQ